MYKLPSRVAATPFRASMASATKIVCVAGLVCAANAPTAQTPWTLGDLEIRRVAEISQFNAGKFLPRPPAPGTSLLQVVGTLRAGDGQAPFGPTAITGIQLAAKDPAGQAWQASAVAAGTYASGGCQYFPAKLAPARTATVVLRPAGEANLRQASEADAVELSIRAAEVKVCFAFETPHEVPASGILSAAGQTIRFGDEAREAREALNSVSLDTLALWLIGAAAIAGIAVALILLRRRRAKRS